MVLPDKSGSLLRNGKPIHALLYINIYLLLYNNATTGLPFNINHQINILR